MKTERPVSAHPAKTIKVPKLNSLLNAEVNPETIQPLNEERVTVNEAFTADQLRAVWNEFAERRKIYQAEYHLLTQALVINGNQVVLHFHNPIQETLLHDLKAEITTFLRERLKNSSITVTGELQSTTEKKVLYTNREKFDHLAEKNPLLKELKDRLGLDTDF